MTIASRAAQLSVFITCPQFCLVDPDDHVSELWNQDGQCVHLLEPAFVDDQGRGAEVGPLDKARPGEPVMLQLTVTTNPSGRETASPGLYVDERMFSIEQALALAATITETVSAYRAAGGVA